MIGELIKRNKNEENKKYSIIHWQTGEPKEFGEYLVSLNNGEVRTSYACEKIEGGFSFVLGQVRIIAWCKLSDIKPYKEKEGQ